MAGLVFAAGAEVVAENVVHGAGRHPEAGLRGTGEGREDGIDVDGLGRLAHDMKIGVIHGIVALLVEVGLVDGGGGC